MDVSKLMNDPGFDAVAECERYTAGFGDLEQRLTALTASAESADGLIEVTVGAGGQLRGLVIDPRVFRDPDAAALAESILDTAASAADDAAHEVRRATEQALGVRHDDDTIWGT